MDSQEPFTLNKVVYTEEEGSVMKASNLMQDMERSRYEYGVSQERNSLNLSGSMVSRKRQGDVMDVQNSHSRERKESSYPTSVN